VRRAGASAFFGEDNYALYRDLPGEPMPQT
jgi:hypothetical protein